VLAPDRSKSFRVAADVGGTFTDIVAFDAASGDTYFGKTLTTPGHLVEGIVTGVDKAGASIERARLFLHGTTIAINTVLERSGARTALLTTSGFRDIYEIGRINRPQAYNLFFRKHQPLIRRSLRFEVNERMNARGEVLEALDDAELIAIAVPGMRIFLSTMVLIGPTIMFITTFQGLSKGKDALVLSLARQFIFFVPALYGLTHLMGLTGVWLSMPISDILGTLTSGLWLLREYRRQKKDPAWFEAQAGSTVAASEVTAT